MAGRTATASRNLPAEPACLTRVLTAPSCTMHSRGPAGPGRAGSRTRAESFTACTASQPESGPSREAVPVRDRLTCPQAGRRAHSPRPLSSTPRAAQPVKQRG
jgi:hypothetical protein